MFRIVCSALVVTSLLACGPRPKPTFDGGEEIDAGMEVDAGRQRGDDPPTGFQVVAPLAMNAGAFTSVASAPDQFGQPLVAFQIEDPNADLNFDDNKVVFTRWSGATKSFAAQQTIEVVGGAAFQHPHRQVSIARDATTGRIAIAYVKPQSSAIRLAVSDDEGTNFSLSTVNDVTAAALSDPVVVLNGGVTHVAWLQGSQLVYRSRMGSAAFNEQRATQDAYVPSSISLAVDSAGAAAVAYIGLVAPNSGEVIFWKPGSAGVSVASADLLDLTPTDRRPSVALTFLGTTPHLAFHLQKLVAPDATQLWYLKSTDQGATWAAPIAIPRNSDGTTFHSTQWYEALVVESATKIAIAAPWAALGTQSVCNGPKLARSTDGVTFMTCAPAGTPVQRSGLWLSMWPHRAGKQTLIFSYDQPANPNLAAGVVMWREP